VRISVTGAEGLLDSGGSKPLRAIRSRRPLELLALEIVRGGR